MKKKVICISMIILGMVILIAHTLKWIPVGYEENDIIFALTYIYAYTGTFWGIGLIVGGVLNIKEWKFLK